MQEESAEKVNSENNGAEQWLCPLCQTGHPDRPSLSLHLTEQHSVLPTCVDKLLDIAIIKRLPGGGEHQEAPQSSGADLLQDRLTEDQSPDLRQSCDIPDNGPLLGDKKMEEDRNIEHDGGEAEPEPKDESHPTAAMQQTIEENKEMNDATEKSVSTNDVPAETNTQSFKCLACQETFPSKTALSVHYNSESHIQRMDPTVAAPSLRYVSNKPYQCAICRVSYNHAITLESHMKSVLHQSRSRTAGIVASAANNAAAASDGTSTSNPQVNTTVTTSSQLVTTTNCGAPGTLMVTTANDASQIHTPQVSHSLLSSPVASAQAVSAFLTLLTSSPGTISHSLFPSLFAHGAVSGAAATQLVPQPQMVMPLILNGLQTQTQQLPETQQGHLLTQCVPFVGLTAAQQALLSQRLNSMQGQWPAAGVTANIQPGLHKQHLGVNGKQEQKSDTNDTVDEKISSQSKDLKNTTTENLAQVENEEGKISLESNEDGLNILKKSTTNGTNLANQEDSEDDEHSPSASMPSHSSLSPVHLNLALSPDSTPIKTLSSTSPCASLDTQKSANALNNQIRMHCNTMGSILADLPALSEFQTEVLWAFFESRSEADAASPPHEDCEALGREVGLSEEEVRKWLSLARYARQKFRATQLEQQHSFTRTTQSSDYDFDDDEERSLIIADVEDDTEAMDLTCSRQKRKRRAGHRDCCLTSDSENELYTSLVVSDEESQSGSLREGADSPGKNEAQQEVPGSKASAGGKVLRSSTVFLSDAEDEYEDEEGNDGQRSQRKKRRQTIEHETEVKNEHDDPDVDLELEAQGDPPSSQSSSMDYITGDNIHSLPLSLTPFSTPFLSPYIVSLGPSMIGDGSKIPIFPSPPTITRFPNTLLSQSLTNQPSQFLSNGDECESALDLSIGKNKSSSSPFHADKIAAQKGQLLDGLGLRPASKGQVVFQVKPDPASAVPSDSGMILVNCNNMARSNIYMRVTEKMKNSILERDHAREKGEEKETDNEQQRKSKGKRYQDMRRSRTIIQAEQLDILYGCYFKDANPGKHEFEQIAEWVHLPKKVVQIWFQNMRARERKGEVRFISDGTLAAVGKPLIKFTWPLSKPIFSNKPNTTNGPRSIATSPIVRTLIKSEKDPVKKVVKPVLCRKTAPVPIKPKELASITSVSTTGSGGSAVPKIKAESTSNASVVDDSPKINPTRLTSPKDSVVATQISLKRKLKEEVEEEKTDDDKDSENETGPGQMSSNRMVPKSLSTSNNRPPAASPAPQKQNGLNYWSSKVPIKINTLSREQLALPIDQKPRSIPPRTILPPPTPSIAPVSPNTPNSLKVPIPRNPAVVKQSPTDSSFHSASRRPRTHLSCRQLSILQSCYETCAHPNAMECEAIGAELNLPLKVVQIWFQNTRAKEKRWRLQQEKTSPAADGKVDLSSGGYLEYSALKANRPILPKPIQLTITESSGAQSMQKEILTGRCDACNVTFESRAAARAHVFLRNHLATLKHTYFGQPATLVGKNASGNGGTGSVVPSTQISSSTMVTSTGAVSEVKLVIDLPPPTVTSNS